MMIYGPYKRVGNRTGHLTKILPLMLIVTTTLLFGCMDDDVLPVSPVDLFGSRGVFIINEGNYLYGNSSLSYYDIESGEVVNDIFSLANGIPLGDVAYSMTLHNGKGYIVVNNSGCIHVVDANTLLYEATIENLPSPRHMLFIDNDLALVSDLYARAISIVNTSTYQVEGTIKTDDSSMLYYRHSSEYLVRVGNRVYTNSWSYDNQVLEIDLEQMQVVDSIRVGIQPLAMVKDKNDNLWVINDGGFAGGPAGVEVPSLMMINTGTNNVDKQFSFASTADAVGQLATNLAGDSLYFICNHLYAMSILDTELPAEPLIARNGRTFRALNIDKQTGDIFISDATDFMSEGTVYRYTSKGLPIDTIGVGIIPGNFCFN
jgi:hypothetical protein